jgi:hypothetical protein
MTEPPFWNLWARFRIWSRENRAQAEIAAIASLAIGLIVLMFLVTIVIVWRLLR